MTPSSVAALLPVGSGRTDTADQDIVSDAATAAANFESFLQLLTAQLENQDPLSPLDAAEFVAQLADFSSVEQLVQTNSKLDGIADQMIASEIASIGNWIGKDVTTDNGAFRGGAEPIQFFADPAIAADGMVARVMTAGGAEIDRFAAVPHSNGRITWDPTTADGVADGADYTLEIDYIRDGAIAQSGPAQVLRSVVGLRGSQSGLEIELGDGTSIQADQVTRVYDAS